MNYILTNYFLYKSENLTSIIFSKGEEYSIINNLNNRSLEITYPEGSKYQDLSHISGMLIRDGDHEITMEGTYLLRTSEVVINGYKFYIPNEINFVSQIRCLDFEMNLIYNTADTIYILLNPNLCLNGKRGDWDWEDYYDFIQLSPLIYLEDVSDRPKFDVYNFDSIDFTFSNEYIVTNNYSFTYKSIAISESDIVNGFIEELNKKYPTYHFSNELTDLTKKDQKVGLIFYETKMAEGESEVSTRIIKHPLYERIIQTTILMNFEHLTDDTEEHQRFRDSMLLGKEFYEFTSFSLKVNDELSWKYTVDWNYEFDVELNRTPRQRYLEDTMLHSMPFSCRIIGFLVFNIREYPTILRTVANHIIDNKVVSKCAELSMKTDTGLYNGSYLLNESYGKLLLTSNTLIDLKYSKLNKYYFK